MASSSSSASSFLAIAILLVLITIMSSTSNTACEAKSTTPAPQLNLLGILEKSGQYTTLMRLLKETQVVDEIQRQLPNSSDGLTIFAPTDNAFSNLKPAGTLNSLTPQEQASLVLYHVLPKYYSFATFQTTSNPVRTQASGNKGVYNVNITSTSSSSSTLQVNVSTGVDQTQISNKLYSDFPLAVYSVDSVLLPYDIFGPKPPPAAAAAAPAAKAPSTTSSDAEDSTTSPSAASFVRVASSGGLVAALICFMSFA